MSPEWSLLEGDCLEVLRGAPDAYFDALCCDPPAGISFMGREWDSNKGGREGWVAWMTLVMKEAFRVLKPGAHGLVWAIPRTSHWTATALEDAGFEVRDVITHHFGSGFPKSQDVGKVMDKLAGAERETIGTNPNAVGRTTNKTGGRLVGGHREDRGERDTLTAPATAEAKTWDGWGTALKPATEHWILVRKPLDKQQKTVARNVLAHGTGALNIDGCRVARDAADVPGWHKTGANGSEGYRAERCPDCVGGVACDTCGGTGMLKGTFVIRAMSPEEIQARCGKGRWPTNLLLSHAESCEIAGYETIAADPEEVGSRDREVPIWQCALDCPVAAIDGQSGASRSSNHRRHNTSEGHNQTASMGQSSGDWQTRGHSDRGGASRFFPTFHYFAKPSRREREAGCETLADRTLHRVNPGGLEHEPRFAPIEVKNNHPTVKGARLMAWLCRLICPPGGWVLDPFAGSGSTGVACMREGMNFCGIEQDPAYCEIGRARIAHAAAEAAGQQRLPGTEDEDDHLLD